MADQIKKVLVPDLSGAENVEVIEVAVKSGDKISENDSLITLEGDKATMDVPAPFGGIVVDVEVKVGDTVSEGSAVLTLDVGSDRANAAQQIKSQPDEAASPAQLVESQTADADVSEGAEAGTVTEIRVPDLGDSEAVDVIEVAVKVGDRVDVNDPLITLEGDKASMEVPSTVAGEVLELKLKAGDKASTNDVIVLLKVAGASPTEQTAKTDMPRPSSATSELPVTELSEGDKISQGFDTLVHAGPAVRRIAREFGVDLTKVTATGPKSRILKTDVQQFVKSRLQVADANSTVVGGFALPNAPKVDFSKFGEIETQQLTKIQKASGANLSRNWISIPHVTQFNEADITELESFRKSQKEYAAQQNVKLTPLVFLIKAVIAALKAFPKFNSSLSSDGQSLILKKYFHIGVAVDTPNGLVVPVIRDADKKGLLELARELGEVSEKARTKGLSMSDMQGGCFSISSLGGIGGTAFTPIINAPEVAILGVSRMQWKPICDKDGASKTRLMLPLSLSYDHRVIDGAVGARFIVYLSERLSDIRTLLL